MQDVDEQQVEKKLETKENAPLSLIIFTLDGKIGPPILLGTACIAIKFFGKCLKVNIIIQLFATYIMYYVFDFEYPESLTMFLGFCNNLFLINNLLMKVLKQYTFFIRDDIHGTILCSLLQSNDNIIIVITSASSVSLSLCLYLCHITCPGYSSESNVAISSNLYCNYQ